MRQFHKKSPASPTTARLHPTYADILCGLVDDPVIGRFLTEEPHVATSRYRRGVTTREKASVRMVAWLEAHDPLFAPTVKMLFEVTESWPPKVEHAFWREVEGEPMKFLGIYADIRELAEDVMCCSYGNSDVAAGVEALWA